MTSKAKRIILLTACIAALSSAPAQITHYGARFGLGPSYVTDDALTSSPIVAMTLGGYLNYGFTESTTFWADNLYLQAGLNINRRGTNFTQELILKQSYRHGYYHLWYAQIPLMACWRYELPTKKAGNIVNLYVGPAFNVGLFGRIWDRKVTPGAPQESDNYDTDITEPKDARRAFKNLRRLDASLIMGVGFQQGPITYDFMWEHNFVALRYNADVLSQIESTDSKKVRNSYTGTLTSFVLSVSYQLPFKF